MDKEYEDAKEDVALLKYTILRRAIAYGGYDISGLKTICMDLEGKTFRELIEVHKRVKLGEFVRPVWIRY